MMKSLRLVLPPPRLLLHLRFHPHNRMVARNVTTVASQMAPTFVPVREQIEESSKTTSSIRIVTYNILAQVYVKSENFPYSPPGCLRWKARSKAVLEYLWKLKADFLCIQELDEYEAFYKGKLHSQGYDSLYIKRPGRKRDGCGIFFRHEKAELLTSKIIDYNDLVPSDDDQETKCKEAPSIVDPEKSKKEDVITSDAKDAGTSGARGDPNDPKVRLKRDCVGIIGAFKVFGPPNTTIILANTHIYWDPDWADVKLTQVKYLIAQILDFKASLEKEYECCPLVIICGDFNSTPGDIVYNFLTSGLNHSNHSRESHSSGNENGSIASEGTPDRCAMPLLSLYASVKEEPEFTNYTPGFTGTLDYIFFCPSVKVKPTSLLALPSRDSPHVLGGIPNFCHPSDHLPIGADFLLT